MILKILIFYCLNDREPQWWKPILLNLVHKLYFGFPFWYSLIFQVGFDGDFYLECESTITTESDKGLERNYTFYDNTTGAKVNTSQVNCTRNASKCKGTIEVKDFKQASASYHCTERFTGIPQLTLYSAVTTVTFDWSKFLCFISDFIIVITLICIL